MQGTPVDELCQTENLVKISEMVSSGYSWDHIRETMEKDTGQKIATIGPIKRAYSVYLARSSEIIAGDSNLKGSLKKVVFDTAERLEKIGKVMDEILDQTRNTPDQKIAASKEILNQLYFQEKMLNRMENSFDFSKISRIEYTKVSTFNLEELDRSDHIIILKRPGMPPLDPAFVKRLREMIEQEYSKFNKPVDIEAEENVVEAEFEEKEEEIDEANSEQEQNN